MHTSLLFLLGLISCVGAQDDFRNRNSDNGNGVARLGFQRNVFSGFNGNNGINGNNGFHNFFGRRNTGNWNVVNNGINGINDNGINGIYGINGNGFNGINGINGINGNGINGNRINGINRINGNGINGINGYYNLHRRTFPRSNFFRRNGNGIFFNDDIDDNDDYFDDYNNFPGFYSPFYQRFGPLYGRSGRRNMAMGPYRRYQLGRFWNGDNFDDDDNYHFTYGRRSWYPMGYTFRSNFPGTVQRTFRPYRRPFVSRAPVLAQGVQTPIRIKAAPVRRYKVPISTARKWFTIRPNVKKPIRKSAVAFRRPLKKPLSKGAFSYKNYLKRPKGRIFAAPKMIKGFNPRMPFLHL